ncbi:hypothetical protein Pelo_19108 [Pelomyxa schiedti]|nr:hypothetical protein Pelo_19108 [Pelomyxa schiedti]
MVILGKVCLFEEGKVRATLPRIKGRIAGKKVALTLDTEATLSILDETTFSDCNTSLLPCKDALFKCWLGWIYWELNIAEGRIQCGGDWMKNFAGPAGCGIKSALMATADCYVRPGDEGAVAIESNNPDDAGRTLSVRSAVLPRGMVHVKEGTTTLDQQRVGRLTVSNSGTTDVVIKREWLVALAKTGIFTTPDDTSATPILQRIGKRAAVAISREVDDAACALLTAEMGDNDWETAATAWEDKPRTAPHTNKGMSTSVSAKEITEMLRINVIKEGKSEWVAPLSLSPKKDGSIRLCTNFRGLNKETIKDNYPLPSVFDVLKALSGHNWFSTLDLMSGFLSGKYLWQRRMCIKLGLHATKANFYST